MSFIDGAVMGLCARLPRGGFALAKLARKVLPSLGLYPARPRFANFELRGDVSHNVFYPLATTGYYAHQTVEDDLLVMLARDSKVIVDIGANIGYTAALMASAAPPGARIIAFEPLPLCQPYLRQINARFPSVEVIARAIGAESGRATFLQRRSIDRSSLIGRGEAPVTEVVQVEVSTLDVELSGLAVDLLKIDVEGFEPDVLKGGHKTISRCAPIVVFEAYEKEVLAFATSFFNEMLNSYALYAISTAGSLRSLSQQRGSIPDTCNFLAWPSRRGPLRSLIIPRSYER